MPSDKQRAELQAITMAELDRAVGASVAAVERILKDAGMTKPAIKINVVWNEPVFEGSTTDKHTLKALGSSLLAEDFQSDEEQNMMIQSLRQSIDDLR